MSEQPPSGPPAPSGAGGFQASPGQFPEVAGGPPSWSRPPRSQSRALTFLALGISVIATVLAIFGWFHPAPAAAPPTQPAGATYSEQQISDAKMSVCDAYASAKKVISGNTHRANPIPGDQVGDLATGIYAPVSLYDSGDYLLRILASNLAAPRDLAEPVEAFGNKLFTLAMADLAGEPDSTLNSIWHKLDTDVVAIDGRCK